MSCFNSRLNVNNKTKPLKLSNSTSDSSNSLNTSSRIIDDLATNPVIDGVAAKEPLRRVPCDLDW